ncbi:hypothetical protein FraQA3DRAFT_4079 [Frankia sp. QA3]|nr:hypothetical protein FraQA3DRAFT_4079 [Frankia sp. QA3]
MHQALVLSALALMLFVPSLISLAAVAPAVRRAAQPAP